MFDSYSVRKSALIISHITFWDCRMHSFSDNLSRNSCKCCRGYTKNVNKGHYKDTLGLREENCLLKLSSMLHEIYIEDIIWPRRDAKFLFECWKIFHEWAQRTSKIFFQHLKRNFVSPSGHVMSSLLYKHQWTTKPFHFNSFLVWKVRFIM